MAWTSPGRFLLTLTVALAAAPLAAQSNDEIQTGTQFNFSTPGARSLALGGAFLGLADDATAAYTNPAGLAQLVAAEFSAEGRAFTFTSRFGEAGHTPLHELTGRGIDTVDGIRDGEIEDSTAGLSFLSWVYPGKRFSLALYRHELANFEASLLTQGLFVGPRSATARLSPARSRLDLEVVNWGVSGAWRLSDAFSLGLGVSYYDFTLGSLTERFFVAPSTGDPTDATLTGGRFGPADFLPENLFNTQVQTGDDDDVAVNAGFLWKMGRRFSLGGVFREGPGFAFDATFVYGPAGTTPGEVDPEVGGAGTFRVPDVFGLGLAYRVGEAAVFTLDVARVEYSDMTDDLVNLLRVGRGEPELYVAEDVEEVHLGFEYQVLEWRRPVSFRAGVWHDPDHRIRYVGDRAIPRARFRPGDDDLHVAFGAGVVVKRAQIDFAVDVSDRSRTFSLSSVMRLR